MTGKFLNLFYMYLSTIQGILVENMQLLFFCIFVKMYPTEMWDLRKVSEKILKLVLYVSEYISRHSDGKYATFIFLHICE